MGLIVLAVFWVAAGFAFFILNAKTALTFIGLWVVGFLIVPALHISPFFFLAYEGVLAACLTVMLKLEWS